MGEVVTQELAAAMVGLGGSEMRRARRLARRGEAAEDVVIARYAVAFARERERRFKRSSFRLGLVLGAAFGLAGIVFAAYSLKRPEPAQAVAAGAFAVLVLANTWRTWQAMRNVEAAERLNREYLRRSGAPYVPGGPPTRVYVPPLAFACSLAIHVAAIVVVGGVATLFLKAEPFSVGKALSVGVSGGVGAAIAAVIGVVAARSREEHRMVGQLWSTSTCVIWTEPAAGQSLSYDYDPGMSATKPKSATTPKVATPPKRRDLSRGLPGTDRERAEQRRGFAEEHRETLRRLGK
jgi:hypothetical protein